MRIYLSSAVKVLRFFQCAEAAHSSCTVHCFWSEATSCNNAASEEASLMFHVTMKEAVKVFTIIEHFCFEITMCMQYVI